MLFRLWFTVFFFKQKTAYELRISDWSSDVCSSDLTICVSPSIATPINRVRVVCALGLTIATFWPTSALTMVDLPALGAPTTATKPQRWVIYPVLRVR